MDLYLVSAWLRFSPFQGSNTCKPYGNDDRGVQYLVLNQESQKTCEIFRYSKSKPSLCSLFCLVKNYWILMVSRTAFYCTPSTKIVTLLLHFTREGTHTHTHYIHVCMYMYTPCVCRVQALLEHAWFDCNQSVQRASSTA